MRNFHLPLPEPVYSELRAEADRRQLPTTTVAREAIDLWLRVQRRKSMHAAVAAYACATAGTEFDLDSTLEAAGIESLLESDAPAR